VVVTDPVATMPCCFSAPGPGIESMATTSITAYTSGGRLVSEMPNCWIGATGRYHFPGLCRAVLPMIPGIYAIYRLAGRRHDIR